MPLAAKHVAGPEYVPDGITERDLVLGKRAVRIIRVLCAISFLALLVMAVHVFQTVPPNTRLPYEGKGFRHGRGMPMSIAVAISFIFPHIWWQALRKRNSHHMRSGTRRTVYIGAAVMLGGAIFGQWAIASAILVEGGVLPG